MSTTSNEGELLHDHDSHTHGTAMNHTFKSINIKVEFYSLCKDTIIRIFTSQARPEHQNSKFNLVELIITRNENKIIFNRNSNEESFGKKMGHVSCWSDH